MGLPKRLLLSALTVPGITAPFEWLGRRRATIFAFHRFTDAERVIRLERTLRYLRKHHYDIVSLPELTKRLAGEGPPPDRTVAFTIDDGYYDLASVALPLFARFDCPVTGFVVTGFLDGSLWLWWDKIEFILAHTQRTQIEVALGPHRLAYRLTNTAEREHACADFTARCKRVRDPIKQTGIVALAAEAKVDLPADPPATYRPMSWEQLRHCETQGATFGAHSVTHPILSQVSEEQSRHEIAHSWDRLCAEASDPINIFAYPNGGEDDFGEREITTIRSLGFTSALSLVPGYNSTDSFRSSATTPYSLPRFNYPDSLPHVIQYVTGIERIRRWIGR